MSLISPQLLLTTFLLFLHRCTLYSAVSAIPHSDPADVEPLYLSPAPPATIPAFPEQSDVAGCHLDLSDDLFHAVKSACAAPRRNAGYGELHRTRCCPVLAAWLYAAYSATALSRVGAANSSVSVNSLPYDMPMLPDDSETCVDGLGAAMKEKGLKLSHPNATCDLVYCYCGIRLHPLSCREEVFVTQSGKLGRSRNVKRLERDCLSHNGTGTVAGAGNGLSGLSGCSKCLKSLHLINKNSSNASKTATEEEDRNSKMHHRDCQLMGLTWLLSKNTTAYIHTITNVLRAIMMNPRDDGSDPLSCSLTTDGLPLAVGSSEISGSSIVSPNDHITLTSTPLIVVLIFLL